MTNQGKKTRVYHAVGGNFRSARDPWAWCPSGFELVAELETEDLDKVFRLTNDCGEDWWLNKGVTAFVVPSRSTSVGDVIVLPNGQGYTVEPIGFRPVGNLDTD